MIGFLARRLLSALPVLLVVSLVSFVIIAIVPGDVTAEIAGADSTEAQRAEIRERLGLDKPMVEQALRWYGRLLQGDLGQSYLLNRPVTEAVLERLPVTLSLAGLALVMAVGFVFDGGLTNFHAAIEAPAITLTLSIVFVLATLLPGLGLAVRRQHDIGLSGWYSLFVLIPSLGSLILLAFSLIPSQKRDNRWGPVPENVIS